MVYWTSPCIDHIPKVFFQYLFFQKSYHIKTIVPSETKLLSETFRTGRFLTSIISKVRFFKLFSLHYMKQPCT